MVGRSSPYEGWVECSECTVCSIRGTHAWPSCAAITWFWYLKDRISPFKGGSKNLLMACAGLAESPTGRLRHDLPSAPPLGRGRNRAKRRPWTGVRGGSSERRKCSRLADRTADGNSGMSRIWRCVLATDNGMAPCVEQGILSLSCCKPVIRKSARPGEWVVGFVPKGKGRGRVAWAGQIAEIVPLGDYEKRFTGRPDAIYRLAHSTSDDQEVLVPLRDDYHNDDLSRSRDLRGKNALIFDPFWYWGGFGITAPEEIANLAHYYVGQSTKNSSPERIGILEAWLRSKAEPGIHGEPRDQRQTKSHG